jgi:LacI family transcriptional regulator
MAKQTSSKQRGSSATIRDVADRAGVSMSTVSHVINATRFVSEEKRQRVLDAMGALHYRPNSLARSLRRQRSFTIGVVVPDSRNPYFADIARGIEDVGFDLGYTVTICSTDERSDKEDVYVNSLIDRQIDGVAIVVAGASTASVRLLVEQGVPTVVVDRDVPDVAVDSVVIDNYAGGYAVGEHLATLGYKVCAAVVGPEENIPIAERLRGYRDALAAHGVPLRADLTAYGRLDLEAGYEALRRLLALEPGLEAVFATNDLTAVGALRAAAELGYARPSGLAVVGYDNIDLAAYTMPALTTVAQPRYEIGRHAARMLLRRIAEPQAATELLRLQPQLVVRESSGPRDAVG